MVTPGSQVSSKGHDFQLREMFWLRNVGARRAPP